MKAAQSAAVTELGSYNRFSRTAWRIVMMRWMSLGTALRSVM